MTFTESFRAPTGKEYKATGKDYAAARATVAEQIAADLAAYPSETTMNTRPITVAWVVPTREPVDLDTRRVDLGEPVKWRDTYVAKACLWALDGSDADLKTAQAFAAKPDHDYAVEVVQWDRDYPDLMQRAKAHALETLVPKPEPEPVPAQPTPKRKKG